MNLTFHSFLDSYDKKFQTKDARNFRRNPDGKKKRSFADSYWPDLVYIYLDSRLMKALPLPRIILWMNTLMTELGTFKSRKQISFLALFSESPLKTCIAINEEKKFRYPRNAFVAHNCLNNNYFFYFLQSHRQVTSISRRVLISSSPFLLFSTVYGTLLGAFKRKLKSFWNKTIYSRVPGHRSWKFHKPNDN